MEDRGYSEKDEKGRGYDEKDLRKRDEKDEKEQQKHHEKSVDEKYRRDPLSAIIWAVILIWAGLVLLADTSGLLGIGRIQVAGLPFGIPFVGWGVWQLILLGIGAILLIEILVRLLVPAYRAHIGGTLIAAVVVFGLAFGNWAVTWPLILVAVGLIILVSGLVRRTGGPD